MKKFFISLLNLDKEAADPHVAKDAYINIFMWEMKAALAMFPVFMLAMLMFKTNVVVIIAEIFMIALYVKFVFDRGSVLREDLKRINQIIKDLEEAKKQEKNEAV